MSQMGVVHVLAVQRNPQFEQEGKYVLFVQMEQSSLWI